MAVSTDVSWNAPSTSAGVAPARITTTAATPSVAPMLRSAWLVPAPAANRAGARPCTAALDSCGSVSATPRPISRYTGSHRVTYAGSAGMVALPIDAVANTSPPAISSGRWPIREASLPNRGARMATRIGPGVIANPASSVE